MDFFENATGLFTFALLFAIGVVMLNLARQRTPPLDPAEVPPELPAEAEIAAADIGYGPTGAFILGALLILGSRAAGPAMMLAYVGGIVLIVGAVMAAVTKDLPER